MFCAEDEVDEDRRQRLRHVLVPLSFDFLSALVLREEHQSWAVGPGFHISHLWRSETKSKAPSSRPLGILTLTPRDDFGH